ncbi:MAG: hypothetical protein ACRYGK_18100, partial [Janthinobacterium lividum]
MSCPITSGARSPATSTPVQRSARRQPLPPNLAGRKNAAWRDCDTPLAVQTDGAASRVAALAEGLNAGTLQTPPRLRSQALLPAPAGQIAQQVEQRNVTQLRKTLTGLTQALDRHAAGAAALLSLLQAVEPLQSLADLWCAEVHDSLDRELDAADEARKLMANLQILLMKRSPAPVASAAEFEPDQHDVWLNQVVNECGKIDTLLTKHASGVREFGNALLVDGLALLMGADTQASQADGGQAIGLASPTVSHDPGHWLASDTATPSSARTTIGLARQKRWREEQYQAGRQGMAAIVLELVHMIGVCSTIAMPDFCTLAVRRIMRLHLQLEHWYECAAARQGSPDNISLYGHVAFAVREIMAPFHRPNHGLPSAAHATVLHAADRILATITSLISAQRKSAAADSDPALLRERAGSSPARLGQALSASKHPPALTVAPVGPEIGAALEPPLAQADRHPPARPGAPAPTSSVSPAPRTRTPSGKAANAVVVPPGSPAAESTVNDASATAATGQSAATVARRLLPALELAALSNPAQPPRFLPSPGVSSLPASPRQGRTSPRPGPASPRIA